MVRLGGAPLALPSFVTLQFKEFFRLGRALRTTLPSGKGGVVHLFVVYGYQGAEDDSDQLLFTDKLLQAVLAEAQVVCVGQPLLVAGDLSADPFVFPCLAKGISVVGLLIWHWLFLVGLVLHLSLPAGSVGRVVRVRVETFLLAVLTRWLRLMLALLRTGGLLTTSLYSRAFALMLGWLMLLALLFLSLFGLLVG